MRCISWALTPRPYTSNTFNSYTLNSPLQIHMPGAYQYVLHPDCHWQGIWGLFHEHQPPDATLPSAEFWGQPGRSAWDLVCQPTKTRCLLSGKFVLFIYLFFCLTWGDLFFKGAQWRQGRTNININIQIKQRTLKEQYLPSQSKLSTGHVSRLSW